MRYEAALIGQGHDHVAPTRYISTSEAEPKARPLTLIMNTFDRKEGDNLLLWIREVKIPIKVCHAQHLAPKGWFSHT